MATLCWQVAGGLQTFRYHLLWPGHCCCPCSPREGRWCHFLSLPPLNLPRTALGAVCWGQMGCPVYAHTWHIPSSLPSLTLLTPCQEICWLLNTCTAGLCSLKLPWCTCWAAWWVCDHWAVNGAVFPAPLSVAQPFLLLARASAALTSCLEPRGADLPEPVSLRELLTVQLQLAAVQGQMGL